MLVGFKRISSPHICTIPIHDTCMPYIALIAIFQPDITRETQTVS